VARHRYTSFLPRHESLAKTKYPLARNPASNF
jgi:hypothetical protein